MKTKTIIFDFDGVIADTFEFGLGIISKVVSSDVTVKDFIAHHDGNVFEEPVISFTEKAVDDYYAMYSKSITTQKSFITKEEVLRFRELAELFIISSNDTQPIKRFLTHNKLGHFTEVLGADFERSKVKKFNYLFKKYKLEPAECVFITDTLGDIKEGQEAGVKTIAVDFGFHDRHRLQRGNPDYIVSSFRETLKIVQSI